MSIKSFFRRYWVLTAALIILVLFLLPKYCGYTYGGLVSMGVVMYREECRCLGYKFNSKEPLQYLYNPFVGYQCMDCGKNIYCSGIPLGKNCYEWTADGASNYSAEKRVECR